MSRLVKKEPLSLWIVKHLSEVFHYFLNLGTTRCTKLTINLIFAGIVQQVADGASLRFFSSKGFQMIAGGMAKKLDVSLCRESIRKYVLEEEQRVINEIKKAVRNKLVYIKVSKLPSFAYILSTIFPMLLLLVNIAIYII